MELCVYNRISPSWIEDDYRVKSGTILSNSYKPTGTLGKDSETDICHHPSHKIYGRISLGKI
jgi:hypothetical protein